MKVYLDRNLCKIDGAACESCFAGRIEKFFTDPLFDEMDVAQCVVKLEEKEKTDDVFFHIADRDGEEKFLHVTKENWPDAYNSWMTLYEQQSVESPN